MERFSDPQPVGPEHSVAEFDCGAASLDVWLSKHALVASASGSARAFVVTDAEQARVVGYHALTAGTVGHREATDRVARGMPRHPIPVVVLARLAVDRSVQGRGLGAWLLRDAMLRALTAAEEVGIRAMLVHALDEGARGFYLRHGFEPSPADPHALQILMKDVRASIG